MVDDAGAGGAPRLGRPVPDVLSAAVGEDVARREYEYESDGDDGLLVQVRALTRCGGVAPIAIRSGCDNPRHAVHARCAKDWLRSDTLKNDALKALRPLPKLADQKGPGRWVALNWRCPAGDCGHAVGVGACAV